MPTANLVGRHACYTSRHQAKRRWEEVVRLGRSRHVLPSEAKLVWKVVRLDHRWQPLLSKAAVVRFCTLYWNGTSLSSNVRSIGALLIQFIPNLPLALPGTQWYYILRLVRCFCDVFKTAIVATTVMIARASSLAFVFQVNAFHFCCPAGFRRRLSRPAIDSKACATVLAPCRLVSLCVARGVTHSDQRVPAPLSELSKTGVGFQRLFLRIPIGLIGDVVVTVCSLPLANLVLEIACGVTFDCFTKGTHKTHLR